MFDRFFAKKVYPELEGVVYFLSTQMALDTNEWVVKKQIGTYHKAYSYIAQGHGITISFYENPLKEPTRKQQTELIVTCENKPWLKLLAYQNKQNKQHLDVNPLLECSGWKLQSNNQELARYILGRVETSAFFDQLNALELVLERQRLYVRWDWLPSTVAREEELGRTVRFLRKLVQGLDGCLLLQDV